MVHCIKCWPEFFDDILDGKKPFEVRKNDRKYERDDIVVLQEWDPTKQDYTGRSQRLIIKKVWDLAGIGCPGYVAFSFALLEPTMNGWVTR